MGDIAVPDDQPLVNTRGLFRSLSGMAPRPPDLDDQSVNSDTADASDQAAPTQKKLGAFKGVFAPVALSMFSTLLFLRVGYVVGNAGFLLTVGQMLIAYSILLFTVLSICALATNGAVEGGGVYYILSRTLGPEFGGSIGILFYVANVVASALFVTGCTESLVNSFGKSHGTLSRNLPDTRWFQFLYSSSINCLNIIISVAGAEYFGHTSLFVLLGVTFCTGSVMLSFCLDNSVVNTFTNLVPAMANCTDCSLPVCNCTHTAVNGSFHGLASTSLDKMWTNFESNFYPEFSMDCESHDFTGQDVSFAIVFGVLFSGVTGIMAGANLSGDLASPSKSIPKGTLGACAFTFSTYFILFLLTAMTCDRNLLYHDCMYMDEFTFWKPLVVIGTILATFCSGLSNLLGGSRVLFAVAKDDMFGVFLTWLRKGPGDGNPTIAVIVTGVFVNAFMLIGSLNLIAQLCSVFFLLSYASVNLACLGLELASAPNFRPNFKYFSKWTCLMGLMGTVVMMFVINPMYSAVGILLSMSLVLCLNLFSPVVGTRSAQWGSMSQAILFHQVRKYLLLLDPRKEHIKFWRPQILLLMNNPRYNCALIDFVNALKKGGLYVLGHVKLQEALDIDSPDVSATETPKWLSLIDHLKVKAFVEVTASFSIRAGIQQLVRISGIGAMKPNTVVLGFFSNEPKHDDFGDPMSDFKSELLHHSFPKSGERERSEVEMEDRAKEYVSVITDVLALQKNLVLCRNFQSLDRSSIFQQGAGLFRQGRNVHLDVWLVDFFHPSENKVNHITSLFLMQLACIVNMVPRWKKFKLRTFICVKPTDPTEEVEGREKSLKKLLEESLRIKSQIASVTFETTNSVGPATEEDIARANEMILSLCDETAVSFFYLPRPPKNKDLHCEYLKFLDRLTVNLPPSVLVHGISPVISLSL